MLDSETKRRIDTARDILVGKVPDPKSQVEQITIALIYKFMDDMDAESEELGGERKFFAGEFARYGWAKLMRSGLGGHEALGLYAEAITRMPENPGIPPLFRDIFKNAYLPYRDPETLRAFLRIIDDFNYDHSERLGDAFEYLLSVLGSQGDAGQFRTPRNIIDFVVSIVDPKKDETVLDPACGTAGFLISSYKHILAANRDSGGNSTLTPDERGRLAGNFKGYDISPDMVRLSLVNMYLHGFTDPHVYEYDTLTSQDRWNEYADVILANPPFMSPRGGIRPHNRFSVQSKRSEVLFVDYMAEHLTPTGRAGIIVPEGIAFQSGTAYKRLRELLVADLLVGVISLPSGVFQPYTGVKTSILVLDRQMAKRSPAIMFSEVKHIGVSLGIKRAAIEANDLPVILDDYHALREGRELSKQSWLASREEVFASDCVLAGGRYRPIVVSGNRRYVELRKVCELERGRFSSTKTPPGPYPLIVTAAAPRSSSEYQFDSPTVCVPLISSKGHGKAAVSRIHMGTGRYALADLLVALRPLDDTELDFRYLYHALNGNKPAIAALMKGAANVGMKPEDLAQLAIPVPDLAEQRRVAAQIEAYESVISGAHSAAQNYRPRLPFDTAWPVAELGSLFQTKAGATPRRNRLEYFEGGTIPWVKTLDLTDGPVTATQEMITEAALHETRLSVLPVGTVLVAMYGGFSQIGRTGVLEIEAAHNQATTALLPSPEVNPYYLNAVLNASKDYWRAIANSSRKDPNITKGDVLRFRLSLPPAEVQEAIVRDITEERVLVSACLELAARFERRRETALSDIWLSEDERPPV